MSLLFVVVTGRNRGRMRMRTMIMMMMMMIMPMWYLECAMIALHLKCYALGHNPFLAVLQQHHRKDIVTMRANIPCRYKELLNHVNNSVTKLGTHTQ